MGCEGCETVFDRQCVLVAVDYGAGDKGQQALFAYHDTECVIAACEIIMRLYFWSDCYRYGVDLPQKKALCAFGLHGAVK